MDNKSYHLEPQVSVEDSKLISSGFPEGSISIDSSLIYVGSETFILYERAHCEIHLYTEADCNGKVTRLYWFQFEGYLPSMKQYSYDYSKDPYRTRIDKHEFFDSALYFNVENSQTNWSDDSDTMHVRRLLDKKGFKLTGDLMLLRLVRLDEDRKQEIMIIYMENLAQHGLSIYDFLGQCGDLKWKEASAGLRKRALAGMELELK